ncbi:Pre-mRNA-splicing factor prp1 [Wickerhamiella sorbophila]|uniref:Pre-mRNA-splicing factor prp1 n=1 Tax=Wickerhamiella sorbophila TaxID=45607 RepID=A0A2T0FJD0_9ASCO|nr:Pre-mRNA-splicing factor prp1 [Wickerhamiella sorbophila]PRT55057.1 Pre-mRNA-splicing factor prp1 [Wickerhamiella sorbophila]
MFAGKDFLTMQPPPGYKAGIGRGATGFTTRADAPLTAAEIQLPNDPDRYRDPDETGILGGTKLAKDDQEAVKEYMKLNEKLSHKRKVIKEQVDEPDPVKEELATVSLDEWANLPEATDLTRRNKRLRQEEDMQKRWYTAPDSVAQTSSAFDNSIEVDEEKLQAKDQALSARLDLVFKPRKAEQSLAPQGAERKRTLLETMIKTQPNNPQGYIGLARIEAQLSQPKKARIAIQKGMKHCPGVPEIWLEALKFHSGADTLAIAQKAVDNVPKSPEVWRAVIDLQYTDEDKLNYVHQALEHLSDNSALWELAIDLESPQDRKDVIGIALELAPSPSLYLKAAEYDKAVLDAAVKKYPDNKTLWLAKIKKGGSIKDAIRSTGPDGWIDVALTCDDSPTLTKIVDALDLTEEDFNRLCEAGNYSAAKLVAQKIPKTVQLYTKYAAFDADILQEAVERYADSEEIQLEYAKRFPEQAAQKFSSENVLVNIGEHFLDSCQIDTALTVLSRTVSDEGQSLYVDALIRAGKPVDKVIEQALANHPFSEKLFLQQARIFKNADMLAAATVKLPKSEHLWVEYATHLPDVRARAVLLSAQSQCPKSAALWLARIRLEKKSGRNVDYLLTKALQECPQDGGLWAEKLVLTPRIQRNKQIATAVKASNNSPAVLTAAGLHLWTTGKDSVAKWFEAAIKNDPQYGDAYMWLYAYGQKEALDKFLVAKPRKGELWGPTFSQNRGFPLKDVFITATSTLHNPF